MRPADTISLHYNGQVLHNRTFSNNKDRQEVIRQWNHMYALDKPKKHPVMFIVKLNKGQTINYMAVPGLLNDYKVALKSTTTDKLNDHICLLVSQHTKISIEDIKGQRRYRNITVARQIFFYLSRKYTKLAFRILGEYLGDRDHTTVLHSIKTIQDLMDTDPSIKQLVDEIESNICFYHEPEKELHYNILTPVNN